MAFPPNRRIFLQSASLAVAALPLAAKTAFAEIPPAPEPFKLLTAGRIEDSMQHLSAAPGNETLYSSPSLPFNVVLTTEAKKSAQEFEWHEGRDHILQVLDGVTTYELGGTPQGAHNTRPGEWLAPTSTGATTYTLKKGDMLIIPRNIPHKRSTETTVTFYLISTTGGIKP